MNSLKSKWQRATIGLFRAKLLILLSTLLAAVSIYYGLVWIIGVLDGSSTAGGAVWSILVYGALIALFAGMIWFVVSLSALRRAVATSDARSVTLLRAGVLIQLAVSAAVVVLPMVQVDPYTPLMLAATGLLALVAVCAWAIQLWACYLLKNAAAFPQAARRGMVYVFVSLILAPIGVVAACVGSFVHMGAGLFTLLTVLVISMGLELVGWRCVASSEEPEG